MTEHLAYWKDIRSVLFSEAEFTMLCRVARSALQSTWTPVKLAQLFLPFAPDLVEQINTASRSSLEGQSGGTSVNTNDLLLGQALRTYKDELLVSAGKELSDDEQRRIEDTIASVQSWSGSVTGQRNAFSMVHLLMSALIEEPLDASQDLELRDRARTSSGLPLFPSLSQGMTTIIGGTATPPSDDATRLLDVEVVAIYW